MTRVKPNPTKRLYVEGTSDLYVLAALASRCGVDWNRQEPPITIETISNSDVLIAEVPSLADRLLNAWDNRKVTHLGLILDADFSDSEVPAANARWQQIDGYCDLLSVPRTEARNRQNGHIFRRADGKTFSASVMPDNTSPGMLEDFLQACIPPAGQPLLQFAKQAASEAKRTHQAPFIENHLPKAELATWFAWQNPPHLQLTNAARDFQPDLASPTLVTFMQWFQAAFDLPATPPPTTPGA